jgi:ferrous iron transport protein A
MKLSELKKGIEARVANISSDGELKQRFNSFGLIKGANIIVDEISLTHNTIAVIVDSTSVALRLKEAESIEVEVL